MTELSVQDRIALAGTALAEGRIIQHDWQREEDDRWLVCALASFGAPGEIKSPSDCLIAAAPRSEAAAPSRPRRLQRSRKRGARTPEGARYVGRPTIFGNPFRIERFGHARSVALHRRWIAGRLGALSLERLGFCPNEIDALGRWRGRLLDRLPELRGTDLQCWCPLTSRWCHADTLLALANRATRHA